MFGKKLVPKIILEGTRLTHKTDLAIALNEHPDVVGPRRYRYHSPLVSAEWCAFTDVPWGRGLINYAPDEHFLAMETYATWLRLFELQRHYSWIVDRFHLSTRAYQSAVHHRDVDFTDLERRLVALGFRLVFCTRDPASFEAAREARLRVSGNPGQYDDLGAFIAEQDRFRELVRSSRLPTFELDVSSGDIPALTQRVADWMRDTGGLYSQS